MADLSLGDYERVVRPGQMREPLLLQHPHRWTDNDGRQVERWVDITMIYASTQTMTVAEHLRGDIMSETFDRKWITWWRADIQVGDRLIDDQGIAYYITRIDDPDGRKRQLILYARRVEPRGTVTT